MRLAAAVLFVARVAIAEPQTSPGSLVETDSGLFFAWSAPAPCPEKAEVLARAERLIGHGLTRASGEQSIELRATVQQFSDGSWRLSVVSGSAGESNRSVNASSCDELADAMALVLALSVDPDYAARSSAVQAPEAHAPVADTPSAPNARPAAALPPFIVEPAHAAAVHADSRSSRVGTPMQWTLGVLGALWVGRLPGVAPGGVLRGALSRQASVIGVEAGFFPAQRVVKQSLGGDVSLATFGASVGYALFDGLLAPHVGLELDLMHGVGTDLERPRSGDIWLLGVDAGVRVSYPLQPALRLVAGGQVSVLAEQAQFHIEPDLTLFRPARVAVQLGLGAEIRVH